MNLPNERSCECGQAGTITEQQYLEPHQRRPDVAPDYRVIRCDSCGHVDWDEELDQLPGSQARRDQLGVHGELQLLAMEPQLPQPHNRPTIVIGPSEEPPDETDWRGEAWKYYEDLMDAVTGLSRDVDSVLSPNDEQQLDNTEGR